jgi:hypothetical protein
LLKNKTAANPIDLPALPSCTFAMSAATSIRLPAENKALPGRAVSQYVAESDADARHIGQGHGYAG